MNTKLPADLHYHPDFISDHRAAYGDLLEEFFAQEPEFVSFGGSRIGNLAFRTDRPNSYTERIKMGRRDLRRRLWLPTTGLIAGRVAAVTGVMPSVAVFNFYRDGDDYIGLHSDYDHQAGPSVDDVVVATVSLGAPRISKLTQIDGAAEYQRVLEPGSLFIMRGRTQRKWLHSIPKMECSGARLSITFIHHQLDPASKQCWVLSKITDDQAAQMRDLGGDRDTMDAASEIVRGYTGPVPTPVLIGSRIEVFTAWCSRPDWESCMVIGPTIDPILDPALLVDLHPDLLEHIPTDAVIPRDRFELLVDLPPLPPDPSLPTPDPSLLTDMSTEWLSEMIETAQKELERRSS